MIIGEREDITEDFTLRCQLAEMFVLMRRNHVTFCKRVVAKDRQQRFALHGDENQCYVRLLLTLFGFGKRKGTGEPDLSQFAYKPEAMTTRGRRVVRKELAKHLRITDEVLKRALRRLADRGIIKRKVIRYRSETGRMVSELYVKLDVNTLRTFVYRQAEESKLVTIVVAEASPDMEEGGSGTAAGSGTDANEPGPVTNNGVSDGKTKGSFYGGSNSAAKFVSNWVVATGGEVAS